jgi:drug/metabolite transporter (DMT)-like permease
MDGTTDTIQKGLKQPLRPLGVTVGVLLVVATLATVVSAPWQTHASMATVIIQLLAALAMGVIGVGLAYVSWAAEA